jgi:hypothetical protein
LTSLTDDDTKIDELIKEGYIDSKMYTKNINLTEVKQKKEDKVLNFSCKKYNTNGKLYITKETSKKLNIIKTDPKQYKTFKDYFVNGLQHREGLKERGERISTIEKKKKKVSSTMRIKEINLEGGSYPMKTEYNKKDGSDSDDYEIEYIEKLKKKEGCKVHIKPINLSVWVSEEFPVKMTHFLPLLHILSFTSNEFAQLKSTLISSFPFNSFPLKISFPIGMTFYALLSVTAFSQKAVDESIFDLNYINELETPKNNNNNQDLWDNHYGEDFYEKYYKEKNIDSKSNFSDSFSSIAKIRGNDIFSDDDQMTDRQDEYYINTEKIDYALTKQDIINQSNGGHDDLNSKKLNYDSSSKYNP